MKALLLIVIFVLPISLFGQANTTTYDQLISQSGSLIASGNLDAAKQAAQQALQMDSEQWRGNALMATILEKQGDFTNAQIYIQKAIANAPEDKRDKLNEMAQTIATSTAQGASATSDEMSPEARIKYDALMLVAQEADQATLEEDRKKALREFMARSAAFLEMVPNQTNIWMMRAVTAVELDYPDDGFYAGQKLKELGLETSDDPKVQRAFAELELKDWLGDNIKWRDWSKWTTDQVKAAANQGDEEAQDALGDWYANGQSGLSQDYGEAANWYRKAADQGNACAQNSLGWIYMNGKEVAQDYTQALNWFWKAVIQSNAGAEDNLGWMYQNGLGVTQDYGQALDWYWKSAVQGNADAQNDLGVMYENGLGTTPDYEQAVIWFRKAADQGNPAGQSNLAVMYENGEGVPQNYAQALDWFRKSAAQSFSFGQSGLGDMYLNGWGVTQDYAQALAWYQKSAAQGNAAAQCNLGVMYLNGWGATQDYGQALAWLQESAEKGIADAQDDLGVMYQNGDGVEKNISEAKIWYQKAADQGNEAAKRALAKLNNPNQ